MAYGRVYDAVKVRRPGLSSDDIAGGVTDGRVWIETGMSRRPAQIDEYVYPNQLAGVEDIDLFLISNSAAATAAATAVRATISSATMAAMAGSRINDEAATVIRTGFPWRVSSARSFKLGIIPLCVCPLAEQPLK
jgi:hypothetical protein